MRRLILVATGILLASVAGSLCLAGGLVVEAALSPERTSLAIANVAALLVAELQKGTAGQLARMTLRAVSSGLVAICLLPVCLVALVGEAAQVRSLLWAVAGTGIVTAAVPFILRAASGPVQAPISAEEGRLTLLLFLTGVATGLVYWLVAGASAGRPR